MWSPRWVILVAEESAGFWRSSKRRGCAVLQGALGIRVVTGIWERALARVVSSGTCAPLAPLGTGSSGGICRRNQRGQMSRNSLGTVVDCRAHLLSLVYSWGWSTWVRELASWGLDGWPGAGVFLVFFPARGSGGVAGCCWCISNGQGVSVALWMLALLSPP